jgi:2,4-dienoyl-CoA reductase-like NADH-dependent reductase (Old Yellow Enzyme family)
MPSQNGRYPNVASSYQIGPVTLPNRIVFPAWQVNYANQDGTVSDKVMKFYADLA